MVSTAYGWLPGFVCGYDHKLDSLSPFHFFLHRIAGSGNGEGGIFTTHGTNTTRIALGSEELI